MKENSIEKKLKNIQNVDLVTLLRQFKKEGVKNFIVIRRSNFDEILSDYKRVLKENEELKKELNEENKRCMMLAVEKQDYFEKYKYHLQQNESLTKEFSNVIPIQKIKDIIDRIDYDIKKTKEIISKNTNIYASYRKNDYQIVRLRAMNTKSLDIKKRLQELLESEE